jgi:F0F1-type ATP synthase membrane subunit b/b'
MGILNDIHTYLIISFLGMAYLLYKYAYQNVIGLLRSKIRYISDTISQAEQQKQSTENQVLTLEAEIVETNERISKDIEKAHDVAQRIIDESKILAEQMAIQKKTEHDVAIAKIKKSAALEIQKKFIVLAEKELLRTFETTKNKREIYNVAIDKSITMLEEKIIAGGR